MALEQMSFLIIIVLGLTTVTGLIYTFGWKVSKWDRVIEEFFECRKLCSERAKEYEAKAIHNTQEMGDIKMILKNMVSPVEFSKVTERVDVMFKAYVGDVLSNAKGKPSTSNPAFPNEMLELIYKDLRDYPGANCPERLIRLMNQEKVF